MGVEIITFGCRLNSFESEVMKQAANEAGLPEDKPVFVFNSCAVTKEAERQLRQSIRKTKRSYPDAHIIVTGCAAQIDPTKYHAMEEVSTVLGNQEKLSSKYYHDAFYHNHDMVVSDIMRVEETASHLVHGFEGKVRAFVEVQTGCDHRCSFCIIPFGRGNNRSVPIARIVDQIRHLVASGYKEIVFTGVDITGYGTDLPGNPTLGEMTKRVLRLVPELPRLRLSSIDVAEVDSELRDLIMHEKRLMPHIHISVQSGDNMILKRMKRRHAREDVIRFCEEVRKTRPDIVFGADIIAGFPTETEDMFMQSYRLIEECQFTLLHVFPYSEREGTPAARMPQLPKEVRKIRAERLRLLGEDMLGKQMQAKCGSWASVLIESPSLGRTEDYLPVEFNDPQVVGEILSIKLRNVKNNRFNG